MVERPVVDGKVAGSNPVALVGTYAIKVAQLVEHSTENRVVASSNLAFGKSFGDNSSVGRAIDF